jgi:Mg-chelatase subunit ChlD
MYILVLDSSGSMEGKRWQDVLAESKRFLETL